MLIANKTKAMSATKTTSIDEANKLKLLKNHSIRNDANGKGHYGAPRGTRKHNGVDLLAKDGEDVKLNVQATVKRVGYAYEGDKNYNSYHLDLGGGVTLKLLYMAPMYKKIGSVIPANSIIGQMQDVSKKWGGGMKCHLHVEILKDGVNINPTQFLF